MRGEEWLEAEQEDAEGDQRDAREVQRQRAQRVERQQQTDSADHAWKYGARVVQLEQQPQAAHAQQDVGDRRVGDRQQERFQRRHVRRASRRVGGVQHHIAGGHVDARAVSLAQQVRQVFGNVVGHVGFERFARLQVGAFTHSTLRELGVAATLLGQCADAGNCVVGYLRLHLRGHLRLATVGALSDGRRRADVGRRRHAHQVCRVRDVHPRRASPCSVRRDIHDHRHPRAQDAQVDVAHRVRQTAGCVHVKHDGRGIRVLCVADHPAHVAGHHRIDDAVDLADHHLGPLALGRGCAHGQHERTRKVDQ